MTFCIITHVPHSQYNGNYFAYAPYVNEMNLWLKYVDKVVVVAPLKHFEKTAIHHNYLHDHIEFIAVPEFSLTSFNAICKTILVLPKLLFLIFKAMKKSSHIHLRCPGNMGLLGSVVQILFPKKKKTAKYAGNWDANSKQPFTYKLQKKILSSTIVTNNMNVLVYGEWKHQSKNIKSFFTATYFEKEKITISPKNLNEVVKFIFVGTFTSGKQPVVAIKIVEELKKRNYTVQLELYGEGIEKKSCIDYIEQNNLSDFVFINDAVSREELKVIYQRSHFLILPSKSEGWPKAVAEAMFWSCLPISTSVSCVPIMLDYGKRGILIDSNLDKTIEKIEELLRNQSLYDAKINSALSWSTQFTIDTFEAELKKLITE